MLIDCDSCVMKNTSACGDCVVTAFLQIGPLEVDDVEQQAIDALAEAGLVPKLRLLPGRGDPPTEAAS